MQAVPFRRLLALALVVFLFAGCGQSPRRPAPVDVVGADVTRAQRLLAAGDYAAAADLYRSLATQVRDPRLRADYLLSAAEAAHKGGDWDGARGALEALRGLPLSAAQTLQSRLLSAEILLGQGSTIEALGLLETAPPEAAPTALKIRLYQGRALAYRQLGNLFETANALQQVDGLQTERADRLATQTEILRTLALLNETALTQLQPSPPGVTGGWMELALLVKRHGSKPDELKPRLVEWRQRFPRHPALPELLSDYQAYLQDQLQVASRIAVLLPQSGPFAGVAAAVRDGIVISRYETPPGQRPEIRFYDATDPAGVWPLYSQAVADGAELVIGPLQKDAVTQLLRAGELPVPVLALNRVPLEATPPANLFMFSLAPEDEARQAAERIWLDGKRHPVVLVPQGEWGDRVGNAFNDRWQGLGGKLAGTAHYDSSGHDHSETIMQLLRIDASVARHKEMERWLARNLEFEPRRRADVDAVFLAARPVQAQGLRPQLQYHRAADLPIYATSHAWTGQLSASQAADLKGVMLTDIPWLLAGASGGPDTRSEIARHLPRSASAYARLYALGMDSLRLAPHLKRLQFSRFEALDGSTGNLFMDELNQIHRQLVWVVLEEPPRIIGYAPRMDLQEGFGEQAPIAREDPRPL